MFKCLSDSEALRISLGKLYSFNSSHRCDDKNQNDSNDVYLTEILIRKRI